MQGRTSMVWFFLPIVVIGLVFAFVACREETPAVADSGALFCPDPREFASGVAAFGARESLLVEVAKGDPTDEEAYRLWFAAFHDDGEDVVELDRAFTWEIADPDFIGYFMLDTSGRRSYAALRVQEDIFDRGGDEEPSSTFRVCAANNCPEPETASACGLVCEPRVCTDPITVVAVANLEGRWEIQGIAEGFVQGTLSLRQEGRALRTWLDELRAVVRGRELEFTMGDYRYLGEIHPERSQIEGFAYRMDGAREVLVGPWSAVRILEQE